MLRLPVRSSAVFQLLILLAACRVDESPKAEDSAAVDAVDVDHDGVSFAEGDCDDDDASVGPAQAERCDGVDNNCDGQVDEDLLVDFYADTDEDGFGGAPAGAACEVPTGFLSDSTDCDDLDPDVYPGQEEVCDGVDNDCDALTDEEVGELWYADTDGDGFGDPAVGSVACAALEGQVGNDEDCDDADAAVNPAALEQCDGVDNDCDGEVDEGVWTTFYVDLDADGWGDVATTLEACAPPVGTSVVNGDCDDDDPAYNPGAAESDCTDPADYNCDGSVGYADADGDGFAACADCDDNAAAVNAGADEVCNGIDDDCDGGVDEDSALDAETWYLDADGDGYGDAASTTAACDAPADFVADDTDCDDADPAVSPLGLEMCNGIDDDCDGGVDEDSALDAETWYLDADGDGYGDAASTTAACDAPADFVADDTDCDDADSTVFPGAPEVPYDGVDNDCDGSTVDDDLDGDGFSVADDCDDAEAAVFPGAVEDCSNLVDDDCDGAIDAADSDCVLELTIPVDTSDYDVAAELAYPASGVNVRVTVEAGVTVSSTSAGTPAFTTGALPAGSTVEIVNYGYVQGMGGDGACGYAGAGGAGGDAIEATVDLTVDNTLGGIYGGGGGGGSGNDPAGGGGGAGGGVGCDGGSDSAGGFGGDGGARWGTIAGGDPTLYDGTPGTGGAWGNPGAAGGGGSGGASSTYVESGCCGGQGGAGGGWGGGGGGGLAYNGDRNPGDGGDAGFAVRETGGTVTFIAGDDTTRLKGEVGP